MFDCFKLRRRLTQLERTAAAMAQTQAELAQELNTVATQLGKVQAESTATIAKVATLEALIAAGGPITQEVQDALTAVKGGVQAVDDLIPDTTPPSP